MDSTSVTADIAPPLVERRERPLMHAVLAAARRDWPAFLATILYTAVVWALCEAFGRPSFYHPLVYMPAWSVGLVAWLGLYVVFRELPPAWRSDRARPMQALVARLKPRVTPRFASGVLVFMATGLFTGTFTCAKSLMSDVVPFHSDVMLAKLDAALFMGVDPWRVLQPVLGYPLVTRLIQNIYLCGWTALVVGMLTAVLFSPRLNGVRGRFLAIYFAAWIILGNILAAAFLSGGPVYFAALTGDHARFAPLVDYLSFSNGLLNSSVTIQHKLWALHQQHRMQMGTGISAFPSLHVAMTTLFALTAFHLDRRLGWAMTALAAVIFLGSVHLAWHYAIDGYVSAVFVLVAWFGIAALTPRRAA